MFTRHRACGLLLAATLSVLAQTYFPPPESKGTWRRCKDDAEIRNLARMDPEKLRLIGMQQAQIYGGPWQIVIVRKGYLAGEWFGVPAMPGTTFDAWSCTKSATGIAYGLLLDDSRHRRLPNDVQIDLDTQVMDFIPEAQPLSDQRKKQIRLRHLLTMTSGIKGEGHGLIGLGVAPGGGDFEIALGREPNRYGVSAATTFADPGVSFEYSDAAFAHLSLLFFHATGHEIADVMKERVFAPLGIENVSWDRQGGGGNIGPHTNAHSGLHIAARDFARVGYMLARGGTWNGKEIVPNWWIEVATKSSQEIHPSYGYTFWVNTNGELWPSAPRDTFAFRGYAATRCYVIPSLDLVVVRLGFTPPNWSEESLLPAVLDAVLDRSKNAGNAPAGR
jgi:CubicO group peptidase (beta-lactamase class C family)